MRSTPRTQSRRYVASVYTMIRCAVYTAKIERTSDYKDVWRWYLQGVCPDAAKVFIQARVDAETAIAWFRAGSLPDEAILQIQSGVSLESAKSQAAQVSFGTRPLDNEAVNPTGSQRV